MIEINHKIGNVHMADAIKTFYDDDDYYFLLF